MAALKIWQLLALAPLRDLTDERNAPAAACKYPRQLLYHWVGCVVVLKRTVANQRGHPFGHGYIADR